MSSNNQLYHILKSKIPKHWNMLPLGEVTDFQEGPGILAKDFVEHGVPLLRLRNIENQTVQLEGCNFLDNEKVLKKWAHFALHENDLLISTSASLGRVSVVSKEAVGAIAYTGIIRFRSSSKKLHHNFLRAFLSSSVFIEQAEQMATGSVIRHFGPSHVKRMFIILPSLKEQIQIAELFDILDLRIKLLKETNSTLEAIAQALFKSWFVDFDPVRAKAEGRQPEGIDAETAALFPDSFEETELGLVPKGWKIRSLDSIADYLNGLALQKFPSEDDNWLPVIKIAQLRKGDSYGADRASRNIKPEYIIQNGDVLFSWSGSLEVEIWCGGEGALNQHLFKVTSDTYPKWFYYFWTKHHLAQFRKIAASKATTMGHIQRKHLTEAKVFLPPQSFIDKVNGCFEMLLKKWINNLLQVKTLSMMRDTLLPRLISGQLKLSNNSEDVKANQI